MRFLTLVVAFAVLATLQPPLGAQQQCPEEPTYDSGVTSPSIAIPGFPDRRATTQEILDYFETVDEQSDRVTTRRFATSVRGTPLVYSLVATEANLNNVETIARRQQSLRDPRTTTASRAAAIASSSPAIAWYTANVHGNEQSGGDAAVSILYDLAARTDCATERLLTKLVVGIMPTQNPDGRDSFSRTNAYGFDMNRDWFARTQPETDGKLDVLVKYPPVLFIDAHEQFGSDFFFPPNADPIYHEISPESLHWINDLYGKALAKEFQERRASDPLNWDYFNYDIYDLFYMGYGDTVPTTAFTSAGMTFEKGIVDTDRQRWIEQFVAGMTSLEEAAANKEAILNGYYEAHATALREGRAGKLEENIVVQPDNKVTNKVPDLRVRHYFIPRNRARPDLAKLIGRLLPMGVEIYRLRQPLRVPDLQPYGRSPRPAVVPPGSYWIPMAQPQKRWIQALLGENTYVPFPYFYDVTAWSNPLLMNLDASFSGVRLQPTAKRVRAVPGADLTGPRRRVRFYWFRGDSGRAVAAALFLRRKEARVARVAGGALPEGSFVVARRQRKVLRAAARKFGVVIRGARSEAPSSRRVRNPKVAVYQSGAGGESLGHLRYLLDRVWRLPYDLLTGPEVAAGALAAGGYDVFIVPGTSTGDLNSGREQVRAWIEAGGTYIGTARPGGTGGTPFAVSSGYTTAQTASGEGLQIPGTLFRVRLGRRNPLTVGAPRFAYWYHLGEQLLTQSESGANVGVYPSGSDFWFSGYADGQRQLNGTAGLVDERLGEGRVILFSGEPNFRAFTDGTQFLLANAIVYPKGRRGKNVASRVFAAERRAAVASATPEMGPGRPIRIEVTRDHADEALTVLRRFSPNVALETVRGSAFLVIPNPLGLDLESHPFIHALLPALRRAGIVVRSAIL